jgi:uncharacterized protein
VHDRVARIEVGAEHFDRIVRGPLRRTLIDGFRDLGFEHVTLDLEGYRTGSMNRALRNRK